MRPIETLALSVVVSVAVASSASAGVRLAIREGRVSIVAKDATVAEILAEWTRIGQTKIENADALPGDRVTLELTDVTEEQALAVLLRRAGGYVAVPRADAVPDASRFDRILVMRASLPPAPVAARAAAPPADAAPPDQASGDAGGDAADASAAAADPDTTAADPVVRDPAANATLRAREREAALSDPSVAAALRARAGVAAAPAGEDQAGGSQPAYEPAALAYQTPGYQPSAPPALQAAPDRPPARPLAAGQMTEKRAAAAAAANAVPRDRIVPPQETPQIPAVDTEVDPSLMTPVAPPPQDPAAQEAFKQRQAVEVANPRGLRIPPQVPAPVISQPPGTTGASKPGVSTKTPGGPGGEQ